MAAVREAFWLEGPLRDSFQGPWSLCVHSCLCSSAVHAGIVCRSLFYMFVSTSKQLTKQPANFTLSLREATESQNHRITEVLLELQTSLMRLQRSARVQGSITLKNHGKINESSHILKR